MAANVLDTHAFAYGILKLADFEHAAGPYHHRGLFRDERVCRDGEQSRPSPFVSSARLRFILAWELYLQCMRVFSFSSRNILRRDLHNTVSHVSFLTNSLGN
jgi:hypothetical protein